MPVTVSRDHIGRPEDDDARAVFGYVLSAKWLTGAVADMFFFFFPIEHPAFNDDVDKMYRGLKALSDAHPQMTLSTLATLLFVGSHQKEIFDAQMTLADVAKRIGIKYSSLTRHADILGDGIGQRGGMGLLERGIDRSNPKGRMLKLTNDGLAAIRSIEKAMADPAEA